MIPARVMGEDCSFWAGVLDVLASLLSLLLFFWNVAANMWAVVSFYQEQKYFSMGVFIFLILSSSVLLQTFSWLWYSSEKLDTKVERFMHRHGLLALVHVLQLGVFLRCVGMFELSVSSFEKESTTTMEALRCDLSTLDLFKAFSEGAPQLILMTTNIIQMQDLQLFTVVKIVGSISSISFTVLSYHRTMDTFLRKKMGWSSSIMYFLWNLFLIGPRVVSMSLFASVLPCYVPAHFLSLWILLVFWAWWQKTDFMDSKAGEWLYRATVGLIWYFSWFNIACGSNSVACGRTRHKGIIYHTVIGADTMLLLGLWWWWRSVESARLRPLPINPYILIAMLMIMYIIGVLLKLVYYWIFHSKQPELLRDKIAQGYDTVDSGEEPESVLTASTQTPRITTGIQKRVKTMAVNFYY